MLGDSKAGKKTFMRQFKFKNGKGKGSESSEVELIEKTVRMLGHAEVRCNLKVWL